MQEPKKLKLSNSSHLKFSRSYDFYLCFDFLYKLNDKATVASMTIYMQQIK